MTDSTRRLLDATADVDRAWLVGYLLQTLDAIIVGNTTGMTPAEYARSQFEELIDDYDRIRVKAGLTREEFFGQVPS